MVYLKNDYTPLESLVETYERNGTFSTGEWEKNNKVSVVITTYNQEEQLKKQLLALSRQTYDPKSIEVIIADDGGKRGSGSSLNYVAQNEMPFDVKYVWQPDHGFRAAKVRNEALKEASHETLICLDSDMIPNHNYIRNIMKWHYSAKQYGCKIMTVEDRAFANPEDVSYELIAQRKLDNVKTCKSGRFKSKEDWRHEEYRKLNWLKKIPGSEKDPTYRIASKFGSGMSSFSKADAFEAGLYDEEFNGWGGEDVEFGVRLYEHFNNKLQEKMFFVPVNTVAYHLEHGEKRIDAKEMEKRRRLMWNKITQKRAEGVKPRPEISVYIPCYNQEKFIENTIQSVVSQNFDTSHLEVVVGDDGSTDNSVNKIKKLQAKYKDMLNIRLIGDGKNRGIAENTNRTIRACRGDYIVQLDGDDKLLENAISELHSKMKKNPQASVVFGDCIDVFNNGKKRNHWSCNEYTKKWHDENRHRSDYLQHILEMQRKGMRIHHPRMFRRDAFFKTEGVNTKLVNAVDYDLYTKLVEVGIPLHIKKRLYKYNCDHGNNTSQKKYLLQLANSEIVRKESISREDKRKEFFIVNEDSDNVDRFDINSPLKFVDAYQNALQNNIDPSRKALGESLKYELEKNIKFFRWVLPENARLQLQMLKEKHPENDLAKYYEATYLHKEGLPNQALEVLEDIKHKNNTSERLRAIIEEELKRSKKTWLFKKKDIHKAYA